jgi:hypothetical protein
MKAVREPALTKARVGTDLESGCYSKRIDSVDRPAIWARVQDLNALCCQGLGQCMGLQLAPFAERPLRFRQGGVRPAFGVPDQ